MSGNEKDFKCCLRCGRKLKNPFFRKRGYGEICWRKMQKEGHKKLF